MSKYDWSKAMTQTRFIATDKDGVQVEFQCKPEIDTYYGMWFDLTENGYLCHTHENQLSDFKGNWQDSLEERPNE